MMKIVCPFQVLLITAKLFVADWNNLNYYKKLNNKENFREEKIFALLFVHFRLQMN